VYVQRAACTDKRIPPQLIFTLPIHCVLNSPTCTRLHLPSQAASQGGVFISSSTPAHTHLLFICNLLHLICTRSPRTHLFQGRHAGAHGAAGAHHGLAACQRIQQTLRSTVYAQACAACSCLSPSAGMTACAQAVGFHTDAHVSLAARTEKSVHMTCNPSSLIALTSSEHVHASCGMHRGVPSSRTSHTS